MTAEEYKNYDFGRKWDSEVLPHLKTKEFKKKFRIMKKKYKLAYPKSNVGVDYNNPPNCLGRGDFLDIIANLVEYEKDHPERLTKRERFLLREEERLSKIEEKIDTEELIMTLNLLEKYIEVRLGLDWEHNQDHPIFYIPMDQCYIWNRHFGPWLAKKVCPKERWVVEESKEHCTVVCHHSERVFDILYWSLDGRLEDYCKFHAGQTDWKKLKYTSKDKTLGGKEAYESTRSDTGLCPRSKRKAKDPCFCGDSKVTQCDMMSKGSLDKCCWCSDIRTAEEIKDPNLYIDNVGYVNPLKFGVKYPKDIGYCPKCKKTKISSVELYNQIVSKTKSCRSDSD